MDRMTDIETDNSQTNTEIIVNREIILAEQMDHLLGKHLEVDLLAITGITHSVRSLSRTNGVVVRHANRSSTNKTTTTYNPPTAFSSTGETDNSTGPLSNNNLIQVRVLIGMLILNAIPADVWVILAGFAGHNNNNFPPPSNKISTPNNKPTYMPTRFAMGVDSWAT